MSILSDVQALYSSVRGSWTKSQADIIAHVVLAIVVFWICGATIPKVSVAHLDPKQIADSDWFKLAKDTGILYVCFVIPVVLVTAYAALLRTGGKLKAAVSLQTAAKFSGVSKRAIEQAASKGRLKTKGKGTQRKVTVESLLEYSPPENL